MSHAPATLRIVSSDPPSQGPFVLIDAAAFDSAVHQLFDRAPTPAEADAQPTADAAAPAEGKPAQRRGRQARHT